MQKKLIQYLLPSCFESSSCEGYVNRRNAVILAKLFLITICIVTFFTFLNIATSKVYSALNNSVALVLLIINAIYFKLFNSFKNSFFFFSVTIILLVSVQHAISPVYQSTNILWVVIVLYSSTYLLDYIRTVFLLIIGAILMVASYLIPAFFNIFIEDVNIINASVINVATIILSVYGIYFVSTKISLEEARIQDDLHSSHDMVKSLNESNAALLTVVSHDLGVPISVALNQLGPARNSDESFETVKRSLDKMSEIINEIKKIRAVGSGQLKIGLKKISLGRHIKVALMDLGDMIKQKEIQIDFAQSSSGSEFNIWADSVTLRSSVICNVLSNCIKFSYRGETVSIKIVENLEDIVLIISDVGIGMSSFLINDLFDFEAVTSRPGTENETGTGFGMPLAKMFMDRYGGIIEIRSKDIKDYPKDHGTYFILTFNKV